LKWLDRRLRRRKKRNIKKLPKFEQGRALFKLRYPQYECGLGTYGLPEVRDWNEGSTLKIGAYCSIAEEVKILLGGHHRADWVTTFPFPAFISEAAHIKSYNGSHGDVIVGNDVWLCSGCTILSGVTVGDGAVVAANSLVTKNVEPYSVVGGNPAKFIKWRFSEEVRKALLKSQWWTWSIDEIRSVTELLCSDNVADFLEYAEQRKQPKGT
jgi:acetyltransferase-like isoleucine patch superfamily enzyme